jgi:phosphoglycerate dehydrogenase-like enzyme
MPPAPRPTVIETEPLSESPRRWLAERADLIHRPHADRPGLYKALSKAQGLVVRTYTVVNTELLGHAPELRVVARAGVGLDNIDLDACRSRGITVVHTPSANTEAVVEYIALQMLNAQRTINTLDHDYESSRWHTIREGSISGHSLVGQTLGIVGLGNIGSRVAAFAGALGMRVLYTDIRDIPTHDRYGAEQVTPNQLFQESDFITIHVDGREENKHLVNKKCFDQLKPTAMFINASRGFVVDQQAALRFALSKPNARVVLDVHDPEPVESNSKLLDAPNITLTPHIAAGTKQAKEKMSWVVQDLIRVLNDEMPINSAT